MALVLYKGRSLIITKGLWISVCVWGGGVVESRPHLIVGINPPIGGHRIPTDRLPLVSELMVTMNECPLCYTLKYKTDIGSTSSSG